MKPPMAKSADMPDKVNQTYTISDLAREYAVTTRTLRFYENVGLLAPTRVGRKRLYSRRDRTRLKLALRGKRLGMTLAEIKEVFDLYDSSHGEAGQIERYLDILKEKHAQLLRQRQDIDAALEELDISERRCRAVLERNKRRKDSA